MSQGWAPHQHTRAVIRELVEGTDRTAGLALSGGGFRAAYFHLGVLARLAELGALPRFRFISTVSGGSIIGAAYYLKLKHLLEAQSEPDPHDDYVRLVRELEQEFNAVVAFGLRKNLFSSLRDNAKMMNPFSGWSRTDRVATLLDTHLYRHLATPPGEPPLDRPVELRDLIIDPAGASGSKLYDIDGLNEGREIKVPALVLNASTLNTGHNWRFEAVRMGEHGRVSTDENSEVQRSGSFDPNRTLLPGYFGPAMAEQAASGQDEQEPRVQAPGGVKDFGLARAVAASAAVPGLFPPLTISGMYKDFDVRVVDGGLVDNQGIQALEDHECDLILVSDGSGQMDDKRKVKRLMPFVYSRVVSIYGDRVRDLQLEDSPQVGVINLREGLDPMEIQPGGTWSEADLGIPGVPDQNRPVHRSVSEALSKIRTDLDRFSRREVGGIAGAGYLYVDAYAATGNRGPAERWAFLGEEDKVRRGEPDLVEELKLGQYRFLRSALGGRLARRAIGVAALAVLLLGVLITCLASGVSPLWLRLLLAVGATILLVGAAMIIGPWLDRRNSDLDTGGVSS